MTAPLRSALTLAVLGVLLTLGIFVLTFVGFLLAPLALLLVAFLVWTVMRPRQGSQQAAPASHGTTGDGAEDPEGPHLDRPTTTDFGAGAR